MERDPDTCAALASNFAHDETGDQVEACSRETWLAVRAYAVQKAGTGRKRAKKTRRKRGRPKAEEARLKAVRLAFRATEREQEKIKRASKREGMKAAEWMRRNLLRFADEVIDRPC